MVGLEANAKSRLNQSSAREAGGLLRVAPYKGARDTPLFVLTHDSISPKVQGNALLRNAAVSIRLHAGLLRSARQ